MNKTFTTCIYDLVQVIHNSYKLTSLTVDDKYHNISVYSTVTSHRIECISHDHNYSFLPFVGLILTILLNDCESSNLTEVSITPFYTSLYYCGRNIISLLKV